MLIRTRLEKLLQRFGELEGALSDPDSVKDQTKYQKMTKELSSLRPLVEAFQIYLKTEKEEREIERTLSEKKESPEFRQLYEEELKELKTRKEELILQCENLLLKGSDPNSSRDVILEIRAGTGGEEAALFVADLFRMYSRYAVNHQLKTDLMNTNPTGRGGFKEIIFGVTGQDVYTHFKFESGIHRVQRVPETEANGRVHTSAVTVAVLPEADETDVQLSDGDLRIDVFRASGAGGQHVNKTESAVRITHIPTGLVVQCQDERSQHKNKAKAMRVLMSRLYDAKLAKQHEEMAKARKEQVGSGDRSGKIRTYNFPDQRVTDHRIGLTLHSLNDILDGHLDELVQALERNERERKLAEDAA